MFEQNTNTAFIIPDDSEIHSWDNAPLRLPDECPD